MTTSEKRLLVLSFASLFKALCNGNLEISELDESTLYGWRATREYVFNDRLHIAQRGGGDLHPGHRDLFVEFRSRLTVAEEEDRVLWAPLDGINPWERLNTFLMGLTLPCIEPETRSYTITNIMTAVEAQGLPYQFPPYYSPLDTY